MDPRIPTAIFTLLLSGCDGVNCTNDVRQDLSSPDGRKRMIQFCRDGGATTGFNTQLTILEKGENLPDEAGNAFIADNGEARVSWKPDGGILVIYDHGTRFYKKELHVRGIQIEYREK